MSRARSTYKVVAPAVTGHEAFERTFRVQQNTIEQLIVVLPSMWIFGLTASPIWAALLGLVFVVARAFYAYGYIKTGGGRHLRLHGGTLRHHRPLGGRCYRSDQGILLIRDGIDRT